MARGRTERLMARRFALELDGPLGCAGRRPQEVIVEEPLEIRLGDQRLATPMRTPGNDFELAVGWLWAEGLLDGLPAEVRYCATGSANDTGFNIVTVDPGTGARPVATGDLRPAARLGLVSSSCGICGAEQLDALVDRLDELPPRTWAAEVLAGLGDALDGLQGLFTITGGAHGAAALTLSGEALVVREDIGRHNAVDKVVGRLLLDRRLPAHGCALWTSGRASFEMVQKAWAAGFGALVSVSAPSALAVRTARRAGMVLVGFARNGHCTFYAGEEQVLFTEGPPSGDAAGIAEDEPREPR